MHDHDRERFLPSHDPALYRPAHWIAACSLGGAVALLIGSALSEPRPANEIARAQKSAMIERKAEAIIPAIQSGSDPSPFGYLVHDWIGPVPGFGRL
jgi:hypothetical protein